MSVCFISVMVTMDTKWLTCLVSYIQVNTKVSNFHTYNFSYWPFTLQNVHNVLSYWNLLFSPKGIFFFLISFTRETMETQCCHCSTRPLPFSLHLLMHIGAMTVNQQSDSGMIRPVYFNSHFWLVRLISVLHSASVEYIGRCYQARRTSS